MRLVGRATVAEFALALAVWLGPTVAGHAELVPVGTGPLRAGVVVADITPAGSVWMDGFAARKKPSEGVYKELTASCVVFDNGVTRLAILALDLCRIGEAELVYLRMAAETAGIPPPQVMINCSHNHSGPDLAHKANGEYLALFKARTSRLFAAAVAALEPVLIDYAVGTCTMAVNRRQLDDKGQWVGMRPEPRKPIDPDVPVLRLSSPEGKVRALLFGYACHPSIMADQRLGPDYVGYARDWLAAAYPGCVPVFLQGCGADIKPRYTTASGRFGYVLLDPVAITAELGHELGRAVVVALAAPPSPVPVDRPRAGPAAVAGPVPLAGIVEKVRVPDKGAPDAPSHAVYMGAWRLGDVYLFGSQCELFSSLGLRLKRELHPLRVWTNGYTHWGAGYVPDAASYPESGYEVRQSVVSPATEELVVGNATRYIRALQSGMRGAGPIAEPPPAQP